MSFFTIGMKYIDTHCHLQFEDYDNDREDEINKMREQETLGIVVGVDVASSKQAVKLAEEYDHLFACVGVHPTYDEPHLDELEELVKHPKVVAIGECGFDFFRTPKEEVYDKQKKLFDFQIDLAIKYQKPLTIHARSAYKELYEVLSERKKEAGDKLNVNMHFFGGNMEDAKNFLDLGFTLSFSGVITFARDYDEVVRYAPLSHILTETDSPYATPVPFRGKRNNPRFVSEVVTALAKVREEDEEEVRRIVFENAKRVFKLPI
ncbi:MAG: TatD family hydrolase [Minisyncoccia bacterium]